MFYDILNSIRPRNNLLCVFMSFIKLNASVQRAKEGKNARSHISHNNAHRPNSSYEELDNDRDHPRNCECMTNCPSRNTVVLISIQCWFFFLFFFFGFNQHRNACAYSKHTEKTHSANTLSRNSRVAHCGKQLTTTYQPTQ